LFPFFAVAAAAGVVKVIAGGRDVVPEDEAVLNGSSGTLIVDLRD
jgi:hypothetical protein